MSHTLVQRAAVTIIKELKLTPESNLSTRNSDLVHCIEDHVKKRSPLALAKIVISSNRPIDVNGYELPNGRTFLRAAAAEVLLDEVKLWLQVGSRSVPKMRVAARAG